MEFKRLASQLPVSVLKYLPCENSQSFLVLLDDENLEPQEKATNVWKIDLLGNVIWKIEPLSENAQSDETSVWTNIWRTEGGVVMAYNYTGYEAAVDLASGKLSNHRFIK